MLVRRVQVQCMLLYLWKQQVVNSTKSPLSKLRILRNTSGAGYRASNRSSSVARVPACCLRWERRGREGGKERKSTKKKVNTSARSNRANNKRSALSLEPCRLPASGRATPGPDRVPPIHIYSTCKPPQLCARAGWPKPI